jgi:DNA-binding GntR family transcriptional regulator
MIAVSAQSSMSKAEQIYEVLRSRLVSGHYAFGEILSTYDLAQQLGVSRRPVMDAVIRLQSGGFISIIRQVGCQVVIPDERSVKEHFTVAGILEGAGARLAAGGASEAQIDTIEAAHQRGHGAAEELDVVGFTEANRLFHSAILSASANARLAELAQQAWDLSDFYLRDRRTSDLKMAHAEHEGIFNAIKRRDPDSARQLMEEHLCRFWTEVNFCASSTSGHPVLGSVQAPRSA